MAKVSFKNLTQHFIMNPIYPPQPVEEGAPTFFRYSGFGHSMVVYGNLQSSGPMYYPAGGTVKRFELDLGSDNGAKPDLVISGLNGDFARMGWQGSDADTNSARVYAMLLEGNDKVDLGSKTSEKGLTINFAADGDVGTTFCGNDDVRGDAGIGGAVYGDLVEVRYGNTRYGGDDDIRLSKAQDVFGDVGYVAPNAALIGGDDYIRVSTGYLVVGDVGTLGGHLSAGDDTLIGSQGSQVLVGDALNLGSGTSMRGGNDSIKGGGGIDFIYGDVASLQGGGHVIEGGRDKLFGEGGADVIFAGGGDDKLFGGSGADQLYGEAGNDEIRGEGGADFLAGGAGKDKLTGGQGNDRFLFTAALEAANVDGVTDFRRGDDKLGLGYAFAAIGSELDASEFVSRKSGHAAGNDHHIIYERKTGKLWYDADDDDVGAAVHFATLINKPQSLSHTDFMILVD